MNLEKLETLANDQLLILVTLLSLGVCPGPALDKINY